MLASIYYLPGHGGQISKGLGRALQNRGLSVAGRETTGEFKRIPFSEQIKVVADDLQTYYWNPDARVIANSYGAYLFLNAQRLLPPFVGRVLLLSPIIGEFADDETQMGFIPPQAGKLLELAETDSYPVPTNCEIHVGEQDWQSNPKSVQRWAALLGIRVAVVPEAGHVLDKSYVSDVLDKWLPQIR